MNIFRKNRTENWVIKLFKITNNKIAEQFDMEGCVLSAVDIISQKTELKPTDFDINYKDSRKILNGFKKALKKQKEIVYSFVGFNSDKTNTYFTISNPMLNWTKQPENCSIDIAIQITSELIELESIELITKNLITNFEFDYGYITKLYSNYDSVTERKINKGLFSQSVDLNKTDTAWTFHSIGVLDGFIKRIYRVNYLNQSHFIDSRTKELILRNGIIENISDKVTKWTLNSDEIKQLKKNKQIQKISIITDGLEFLKTEKAKVFKNKMELKKSITYTS